MFNYKMSINNITYRISLIILKYVNFNNMKINKNKACIVFYLSYNNYIIFI